MSRSAYVLVILAGLSGPAWSQTLGESVSTGSPRHFGQLFYRDDNRIAADPRPCLVRRKTGRTECRSMDEWRMLAKNIDKARKAGLERQETR
jgi:hypothetical protein